MQWHLMKQCAVQRICKECNEAITIRDSLWRLLDSMRITYYHIECKERISPTRNTVQKTVQTTELEYRYMPIAPVVSEEFGW